MRRVTDRIVHLTGVRRVTSLVDVTSFRYVPAEDWVEVRPFIEEIPTDPQALAELRRRALADPVYRRTLVSEDGRAAALNVSFRKMTDREFIASGLDRRIGEILSEESRGQLHFHVAGRPHVKSHVYLGVVRDLWFVIPLAIVVMAATLGVVTGSRRGIVLPLGTALGSVLWTFAAIALVGRPLTVLSCLLAPTLLAIGSVYGVHILARYDEEAASSPDAATAVTRSLQHLVAPVLIAGVTTMAGFAALLITDVPAVRELGAFSVFGIASITLLSLTAAPATLAILPLPAQGGRGADSTRRLDRALDRALATLARTTQRHSTAVLLASALAALVAAVAVPRIVIDTDYLTFFDEDAPVRREFEAVNRLLAGAVPLYVVLEGSGAGSFREPEWVSAIEALQKRLDTTHGVSRTLSFVDTMRVLNRAFHAGDPAQERVPETRPGVTELLFMIPKGELERFVTVNHARANVIVRTGEVGSAAVQELAAAIRELLRDGILPEGIAARVTGNAILLARSADGIAHTQPQTVGLAALVIFALIAVGLRSPRLGLVAMIPNLIPVLIFFGLLGLGAAPLSLPTSLIGSVALGIAIDDTVHYLFRYRAERRAGASARDAALHCGRRIGRPIAVTSAMLFLGFMVMAASEFATLREFGVLSAVTMVVCLGTDLVLLPAILVRARL
jgi:predicted RND superfamily exporter protein